MAYDCRESEDDFGSNRAEKRARREAILRSADAYLTVGDLDKPFHEPECECPECEAWRTMMGRPTHEECRKDER